MREKLLNLMKSEGLKPSQLAEMLEINPAGVSHILAGRNKPGFDLLQKILRRFPQINPDWLLLDSDKMYRNVPLLSGMKMPPPVPSSDDLFGMSDRVSAPASIHETPANPARVAAEVAAHIGKGNIERVVIFFDDQTFDSYSPTKR